MQPVGSSSSPFGVSSDVFVTGASSVAALDTPQLSQTKLEIRSIVAEIAEFSASQLPQAEFLNAVLPRICNAMGATAAALWHTNVDSHSQLIGHFRLPNALLFNVDENVGAMSPEQHSHAKILACVAAEGSAVLVPPKSIRMATERPANPLDECLLVVPIKIDDQFEMLLEVIQPASGGPAAQRGYLRFVAQMADLISDYLRRDRLRDFAKAAGYVKLLQSSLLSISAAPDQTHKLKQMATSLCQLLNAELVLVARRRRMLGLPIGWRVCAISNVPAFDTRSEVVMTAERLLAARSDTHPTAVSRFSLVASAAFTNDESVDQPALSAHANCAQQLRELLGCNHVAQLRLDEEGECQVLLAFDEAVDLATARQRAIEMAGALQSLLQLAPTSLAPTSLATSASLDSPAKSPSASNWRSRMQRALMPTSTALLIAACALFPTPDNISTLAVLESVDKELYYAPSSATVDSVYVRTHQAVKQGEPLIKLVDSQLQARLDELLGQRESTREQIRNDELTSKQGIQSSRDDWQLSNRIDQALINLRAIEQQLNIVQAQISQLTIAARRDALVTSWDAQNQLRGRPVSAGQLLLTTHQPNAPWQLRISIPERQLGRLREAMASSRTGLPVQFSLTSHPSEVQHGRLVNVSEQLIKDDAGVAKAMGIVAIDGNSLPARTDGSVARATIVCGRTCAGWLAIRDAYREASAWWRLNW